MANSNFQSEYTKLNPRQQEAVEAIEGPVMVIAGPGTGKTQVLAMRIANILAKTQVNPANILCLTFTNSGVKTMKERLLEIIGPPAYQIQVFTFHAFCNEIIETFPEKFLIAKKINQLDDLEQIFLIQKILKKHQFKFIKPFKAPFYYQKTIINTISKLKQESISPEEFAAIIKRKSDTLQSQRVNLSKAKIIEAETQIAKNKELDICYNDYQKALANEGKYDYNDMILFVLDAFRSDEELLNFYQERFQYILVDEYQDTNSAQNEVVKLLASFYDLPNIFVVGDDEQAIFRFQGASMENILGFRHDYPTSKIIILQSSYRSGQQILDASRGVILQNKNQIFQILKISKHLKSQTKYQSQIHLGEFSSGAVENFFIASEIKKLIEAKVAASSIAVLFRNNRDVEELIDYLSKLNVPYKLEVGENVLDDPEIGKLINFFKALTMKDEPKYNQLLLEIMHYPFFNFSFLDIYKIVNFASSNKKNIFAVLTDDLKKIKLDDEKTVENFVKIFFDCIVYCHNNTFTTAFEKIIDHTGYLQYLLSLKDSIRHLNRLQTLFKYSQALNTKQKKLNLEKFLEHLELLEENDLKIKEGEIDATFSGVNLMTAHKAKGLEFDHIFIMHLADRHWGNKTKRELIKLPSGMLKIQNVIDDNDEEERRLFYVAMTRARKSIYLTLALNYGELENQTLNIPSKFIGEIPPKYLKKIHAAIYEKQFDERLKLTFSKRLWERTDALDEFLKQILAEFQLSSTALNTFLDCPQRFFYDNILRVPKAKDFTQSYGTAVHFALERFFGDFKKTLVLPAKKKLVNYFLEGLRYEIFSDEELIRAKDRGSVILKKYYDFYKPSWQKKGIPLALELNFRSHDVHFGEIPITGIVDKIEVTDKVGGKVRIIDYKTSSPKSLNFLLGKTKEKNTDLLYQAYFYNLLAESDPLFNWKVGEIVFDFISDRGFKQVALPIDARDYAEFKKLVQKTFAQILKLDFPKNAGSCKSRDRTCDYYNICRG